MKKILSLLLCLALVVGMVPSFIVTTYAYDDDICSKCGSYIYDCFCNYYYCEDCGQYSDAEFCMYCDGKEYCPGCGIFGYIGIWGYCDDCESRYIGNCILCGAFDEVGKYGGCYCYDCYYAYVYNYCNRCGTRAILNDYGFCSDCACPYCECGCPDCTCISGGCSECGCSLCDHNYSSVVTAPTCTAKGYTTYTCSACGACYTDNTVAALGHDYVIEVIEPTPDSQGYTKHTCSRCGNTYNDTYVDYQAPDVPFKYTLSNGKVTITGYKGTDTQVTIPGTIEGKPVVAIGARAFASDSSITDITIPEGVTTINESAFYYCTKLATIKLPSTLKTIGDEAFYNCQALSIVSIPDSVTTIGESAFYHCLVLKRITIGTGVTSIGSNAFYSCLKIASVRIKDMAKWCQIAFEDSYANPLYDSRADLYLNGVLVTDLVIPEGVTYINRVVFANCMSITSVTIPTSVTKIDNGAFSGCNKLNAVYITDMAKWCEITFTSSSSNPLYCARNLYLNGTLVTDLEIPGGITNLENTFYNCQSLTSVTIPSSVTSIGEYAFAYCANLSINIPKSVTSIDKWAFYKSSNLVVNCFANSYAHTYCKNNSISYQLISDEHTHAYVSLVTTAATCSTAGVKTYTCSVCGDFYTQEIAPTGEHNYQEEIIAPTPNTAGYTKHTCGVCGNTYNDTFVDYVPEDIPFTYTVAENGVTITGFTGSETVIIIPSEIEGKPVIAIGSNAFYQKRAITSVTIPGTVKSIGANAFRGCTALTEVVFNEGLETISTFAFGATKLKNVVFPKTLKTIGTSAFNGVTTLENIDLANVESIKGTAFANCTKLGSTTSVNRIKIPATVKELGAGAFQNCTSIGRIDWYPVKLTSGGAGNVTTPAFMGCIGIKTAAIYDTAENLPSYLFYKAGKASASKGITSLTFIGESNLKTIGDYAFFQARMGTITLPDSVEKIGKESFRNCNLLKNLNLGAGVNSIGKLAFAFCNGIETVTIPGNVKTIYAYAFRGCAKLKTVVIEEGVEVISSYAFADTALASITLPASLLQVNGGLTNNTSATVYYYEGTYADDYLHSAAAMIKNETLVPIR